MARIASDWGVAVPSVWWFDGGGCYLIVKRRGDSGCWCVSANICKVSSLGFDILKI